jgi:hypothetical protein
LADAQKSNGKIKFINFDSTSWIESTLQTDQTYPTAGVKEITVINRGKGSLLGLGAGLLIGGLMGNFIGKGREPENPEDPGLETLIGTMIGIFIGGVVGFGFGNEYGSKDKYTFATFRINKRSLPLEEPGTYKPGTNMRSGN